MTGAFLRLCNMGITASWIVLGLLLLRLLMRKAPKWINCLLWVIVGLHLVLPVTPVSKLSLLPSAQPIPMDITTNQTPSVQTGFPSVNAIANPVLEKAENLSGIMDNLAILWFVGVGAMLLYGMISYLLLRRKLKASVAVDSRVYICDYVDTPFVLGIFRPGIYLPSDLDETCKEAVLAHERAHLRRHDHWWKPLGFILLSVYWFNPLLWVAYILLCRDIEAACDEKVIKQMDLPDRKGYSLALAQCSTRKARILACPVAFGEVGVKGRIRAILSYKKPAFWLIIGAVVLSLVAAVCFLTAPKPCKHAYDAKITAEATCSAEGVRTYTCSHCKDRYREPIDMLAHTYGEGQVIKTADCIQPGLASHSCTVCGHKAELPIGINDEHRYVGKETKASTCTEPGELTETCTLCGDTKVSALPLAEHDYRVLASFPGTCVDVGSVEYICNVCNHQTREFTPKTGEHYFIDIDGGLCIYCYARPETKKSSTKKTQSTYNPSTTNPHKVMADPFEKMQQASAEGYNPWPTIAWDYSSTTKYNCWGYPENDY